MAWQEMQVVNVTNGGARPFAFEYQESKAAVGNGTSILIPDDVKSVAVILDVTAGTGSIQTTTDSVAKVKAGTATWITWSYGTVGVDTAAVFSPVTAIRMVNASGTTELLVRAQ